MPVELHAGEERTILIAEDFRYRHLKEDLLPHAETLRAVIVRNGMYDEWPADDLDLEVIAAKHLWNHAAPSAPGPAHEHFLAAYDAVVSDVRTHFIAERRWFSTATAVEGAFKNSARIAVLCWNVLSLFDRVQPTRLVCASTPHVEADWVLAYIAELLGIPVLIVGVSPIPWRSWCVEGLRSQVPLPLKSVPVPPGQMDDAPSSDEHRPSSDVLRYVELNRSSTYLQAVPTIDRSSQEAGVPLRTGFANPLANRGDDQQSASRGRRRLSEVRRVSTRYLNQRLSERDQRRLFARYQQLAGHLPSSRPLVSVFLHYQPERTSMPEGGLFSNQVAAVQALAAAVPPDWRIVVKEHPATFHGPGIFFRAFRDPLMYEAMAANRQVSLVDLGITSFEIIDASRLVVTITGTVGFQSLCRGVPVLALGSAAYRGAPGVFSIPDEPAQQMDALRRCFDTLRERPAPVDQAALLQYLAEVETNSLGTYGVADEATGSGEFVPTFATRVRAVRCLTP